MDGVLRQLERESSGGDREARLRLVRQLQRSGRHEEVLALTDAALAEGTPGAHSGVWAARAVSLAHLDRTAEAADAAGIALGADPGALAPELLRELARRLLADAPPDPPPDPRRGPPPDPLARLLALRRCAGLGDAVAPLLEAVRADPDPLARAQAARVPALARGLRDDPSALVRFVARGAPSAPPFPREAAPTRLFSAHGPDFEIGYFVAFEASCALRLASFDAGLLHAVDRLLGPGERQLALGLGYGLGVSSGRATGDLEERAAAVNAAAVLPFPLRVTYGQPFDVLTAVEGGPMAHSGANSGEDERLARRFARDLAGHPARLGAGAETGPYAAILALFHPGAARDDARLAELLVSAREAYGAVGARALELFVERARVEPRARPPVIRGPLRGSLAGRAAAPERQEDATGADAEPAG